MITRILLTPAAAAARVTGDDAVGAAEAGAGLDAVGPGRPALQPATRQPATRQPASPPPISRASRCMGVRLAGTVQASLTAAMTSSRSGRTRASSVTHW